MITPAAALATIGANCVKPRSTQLILDIVWSGIWRILHSEKSKFTGICWYQIWTRPDAVCFSEDRKVPSWQLMQVSMIKYKSVNVPTEEREIILCFCFRLIYVWQVLPRSFRIWCQQVSELTTKKKRGEKKEVFSPWLNSRSLREIRKDTYSITFGHLV